MTAFINKRQQARNERALQDLLHNVPGNDRCADCQTPNPGWASWSLGIFLCIRCAALHRKLGTHISKVKSLSMDTWTSDQVDAMKSTGNTASNRAYNPRNVKPDLPLDPDMIDIAMEKFIRAKYQRRTLGHEDLKPANGYDTGSTTTSTEDRPPPVPAKNPPRFGSGLRSASSTYPVARNERPLPPINEPNGAAVETGLQGNMDDRLLNLRNMGFSDDRKNLTLLKRLNGSVEKTVEALVRLGEGDDATRTAVATGSGVAHPVRSDSLPKTTNGANRLMRTPPAFEPNPGNLVTAGTGANLQNGAAPPPKSWNPFDTSVQQSNAQATPPLDMSFQNMTLSQQQQQPQQQQQQQQQQPLFPNSTGTWQAQNQNNPFLKILTPPLSPSPHQHTNALFSGETPQSYVPSRGFTDPTASFNPFLRSSRSQTFAPSGLSNQLQGSSSYTPQPFSVQSVPPMSTPPPWALAQRSGSQPQVPQDRQPSPFGPKNENPYASQLQGQLQSPFQPYSFQQTQSQQNIFSESPLASPAIQPTSANGGRQATEYPFQTQQPSYPQFFNDDGQQQPQQPEYQQQNYQPSTSPFFNGVQHSQLQVQASLPGIAPRLDKSSILALYNQPYYNPSPVQAGSSLNGQATTEDLSSSAHVEVPAVNATGHNNPFASLTVNGLSEGVTHGREESKDFAALMSRSSGRHSPDAFAGLSARYR